MIQGPEEEPAAKIDAEMKGDIETLKEVLAEERGKAEKYLANWQRAQADFINYKQRSDREKEENSRLANSALMLSLLPILDDLERALASIPPNLAEPGWVDGIILIERKLRASLEVQGLSTIEAVGKPFDPNFHEAAMHGEGEEGMVVEELQKGYTFRDRVLRPSRVVVGAGELEEKTGVEPENSYENSTP